MWRPENRCPESAKSTPGGSKIEPKSLLFRSPCNPNSPGAAKSVQEPPKSTPRAPKSAPRAPQERPRAPKERPSAPQERPKSAQEGPKTPLKALRGALGDHFDVLSSKKERSVARLAREARSERFFVDFRVVHANAAKALTCVWTREIRCFLEVAPSRDELHHDSSIERERIGNSMKSTLRGTQNRPQSDQNRPPERFSSHFGRPSRSKSPLRANLGRLGRAGAPRVCAPVRAHSVTPEPFFAISNKDIVMQ